MAKTERTAAGVQYVIPGVERRTAPRSIYSEEPTGQLLIPGVEPVSDQDRLRRQAEAPLHARLRQRSLPASGLFR